MDIGSVGRTRTSRPIAGGFTLVHAATLTGAWRACRDKQLGSGAFRVWLACHELVTRRGGLAKVLAPRFSYAELAKLVGISEKRCRELVRRLARAGLLEWSESAIIFPAPPREFDPAFADTIGGGQGELAIPRRLLRFLVGGVKPALIATALGLLLRCLSRRRGGFDGRGRVKASWIADVFGVEPRRVKQARKELAALGWIAAEDPDQWSMNRWGRAYRIDLGWAPPAQGQAGTRSAPPRAPAGTRLAPPDLHQEPLRVGIVNQEPASGGPSGTRLTTPGTGTPGSAMMVTFVTSSGPATSVHYASARHDPVPSPASPTRLSVPVPAPVPRRHATTSPGARPPSRPSTAFSRDAAVPAAPAPPRLADVRVEDLKNTSRLMELHRQAVARGVVTDSEADEFHVVAAAEHALAVGQANPCGLFAYLIRGRLWRYLTQTDEVRASARLKAHKRGSVANPILPAAWRPSMAQAVAPYGVTTMTGLVVEGPCSDHGPVAAVSAARAEDVAIVRAVRTATIRAGLYRDPFPEFVKRYPDWSRERWERALEVVTRAGGGLR